MKVTKLRNRNRTELHKRIMMKGRNKKHWTKLKKQRIRKRLRKG